jgi:hypothetical protein
MAGEGSVFRRCGCTDPVTGRQYGTRCPRLAAGGRNGSWYVRLELPAGLDGRRRRIRCGGYPSRKAALEVVGAEYSSVLVRAVDEILGTHRRTGHAAPVRARPCPAPESRRVRASGPAVAALAPAYRARQYPPRAAAAASCGLWP